MDNISNMLEKFKQINKESTIAIYDEIINILNDVANYKSLLIDIINNPRQYRGTEAHHNKMVLIQCLSVLEIELDELFDTIILYPNDTNAIMQKYTNIKKLYQITDEIYKKSIEKPSYNHYQDLANEFYSQSDVKNHLCFLGNNNILIEDSKYLHINGVTIDSILDSLSYIAKLELLTLLQTKNVKRSSYSKFDDLNRISYNECRFVYKNLTSPVDGTHIILICKIFYGDKNRKNDEYQDAYRRYDNLSKEIIELFNKSSYDALDETKRKEHAKKINEYLQFQDEKLGQFIDLVSTKSKNKN